MDKPLQSLIIADHLLSTTYPLVKDPKVLLGVLTNLDLTYAWVMKHVVDKDGLFRSTTFGGRFEQFKHIVEGKLSTGEIESIRIIHELHEEHKKSPVEFVRKQQLVICSDTYGLKTLSHTSLKEHIRHAKSIVNKLLV